MLGSAFYLIIIKRKFLLRMGNCMQANNIVAPQTAQKRSTNVSRVSKKSADAIPTYPSIEDVIRNNRNRKNKDLKDNLVL